MENYLVKILFLFINYEKYKKIDLIYSTSKLVAEFSQSAQKLNFPMKILLKKFWLKLKIQLVCFMSWVILS